MLTFALIIAIAFISTRLAECNTCAQNEFRCHNYNCIPHKWLCDNEDDCGDRSDELDCANHTCSENQFRCASGSGCVPNDWLCDDQEDCSDGSDEYIQQCRNKLVSCNENEFTCANGKCIGRRWKCDGENDCGDNSDESPQLCSNQTCGANMYTCISGKCIPQRWRCDGDRDCPDDDDEKDCDIPDRKDPETVCGPREFMCANGHECIHIQWRCDRSHDCTDLSDEQNCNYTCRSDQFECHNGHCIPDTMKCNGEYECADNSDELNCTVKEPPLIHQYSCNETQFQCAHSSYAKCINRSAVCNGVNDCGDWSDEPNDCNVNECNGSNKCSHICIDDVIGYHCECNKGYRLRNDNQTCDDIDECSENYGICSGHICINQLGHFKCFCFDGYEVKDHRFCKIKGNERPLLMFANRHDVRTINILQNERHQHYDSLYSDLRSTIAVDYSLKDNYLIWSDVADEKLFIAPFDAKKPTYSGITHPQMLINVGGIVDALAVDWIHRLVYWTDTSSDTIEVLNITNPVESRTVLISKDLEEPRGIAINVLESWIVWTDWGSAPKIERSLQDGTDRRVLVKNDIVWPNGITIDFITKRIYWLDAKLNSLSSIDYDGRDRRLIIQSPTFIKHPFSLDIFEDNVYFTDWELESILVANKFGDDNKVEVLLGGVNSVMDVRVVHSYKRPNMKSRCYGARCSHICLPTGLQSYRCVCPNSMTLDSDNVTCKPKSSFNTTTTTSTSSPLTDTTISSPKSHITTTTTTSLQSTPQSVVSVTTHSYADSDSTAKSNVSHKHKGKSDAPFEQRDSHSDGKLAVIITAFLLMISLIIGTLTLFIYRKYQRRHVTSMNFDNPVYRKTTEDQFILEKSDDSLSSSYVSSLEPLTSPGTNEYV